MFSTKWWDPIGNSCLCTSTECQYKDTAVPVNRTGGSNGIAANGSGSSNAASNSMHSQLENVIFILILFFFFLKKQKKNQRPCREKIREFYTNQLLLK